MPTVEEALEYLRDQDIPSEYLEALESNRLRSELKEWREKALKGEEAQKRLAQVERVPQIEEALKAANVDLSSLSKAHRKIVEQELMEGDLTPERVSEVAQEWELPTAQAAEGSQTEETPPAARIAAQALSPGNAADYVATRERLMSEAKTTEEVAQIARDYPLETAS